MKQILKFKKKSSILMLLKFGLFAAVFILSAGCQSNNSQTLNVQEFDEGQIQTIQPE